MKVDASGLELENARLAAQLQNKVRQIELINELSGIINSSLSLGTVFRIIASELRKLITYDRASLLLFDDRKNNLTIFALDTDMKTVLRKGVRAPLTGTSAGWVIRNNRPWINRDLLEGTEFPLDKKLLSEGIRSTVSIPLYWDKVLGVFNLDSTTPCHYSDETVDILLPVAKQMSLALENTLLFEEISKEKKEREKDADAQRQLEQQLIRADKLASLGTLVAGIAHEINNPLGIIAGYSEALLDRCKNSALASMAEFEDFPEYLQTIHKEIFRCKNILKTLLDFARPSGGSTREIDINELIKEVILLVNHKAKKLKHNIELQLNRDLPKVLAEPAALRQLFMNILINSMYFTPERGCIIIGTESLPDTVCEVINARRGIGISIRDTGCGIPKSIIGKIFDPFFTTKPVGEGTGLGLSICHKIVEEHGGTVDASSEEGGGTTFFIKLPARELVRPGRTKSRSLSGTEK